MHANAPGILTSSKSITSKTCWEFKHCSRLMETHWVPTRSLLRSHTSLPRGGPAGLNQKARSGKPGFPFEAHEEHDEHDHEKDECKFKTCYKNLRFHAKSSKHGPGYPYKKIIQEQTQKHGSSSKLSDQNETFFKNM